MSVVGHNSAVGERLRQFIEKIERLHAERDALAGDVREVYSEAKGVGFEPKIMREVLKLRRMDKAALQEQQALLDTYLHALGMGDAAPAPRVRAPAREEAPASAAPAAAPAAASDDELFPGA